MEKKQSTLKQVRKLRRLEKNENWRDSSRRVLQEATRRNLERNDQTPPMHLSLSNPSQSTNIFIRHGKQRRSNKILWQRLSVVLVDLETKRLCSTTRTNSRTNVLLLYIHEISIMSVFTHIALYIIPPSTFERTKAPTPRCKYTSSSRYNFVYLFDCGRLGYWLMSSNFLTRCKQRLLHDLLAGQFVAFQYSPNKLI